MAVALLNISETATNMENDMTDLNNFDFDAIDFGSLDIDGLEIVTLKDAMALPETGASSGISSCNSCSSCGSSSCVGSV